MTFMVCFRNPLEGLVDKCLESLKWQKFKSWEALVVDDCSDSPHGYGEALRISKDDTRVLVHRNSEQLGHMENIFRMCLSANGSILVEVDGDDFLCSSDALRTIVKYFADGADGTYGSCRGVHESNQLALYTAKSFKDIGSLELLCPRAMRKDVWMKVYNRWGELAFKDKHGEWWRDGGIGWYYPVFRIANPSNFVAIREIIYEFTRTGNSHDVYDETYMPRYIEHILGLP